MHLLALLEGVPQTESAAAPAAVPTSERIASSVGVNPVVIRSVMGRLRQAGIVRTQQGVAGAGLTRPLADITLLDVYRAVEPRTDLFTIHSRPNPHCPVGARIQSTLERHFGSAQAALEERLAGTTLQQVVEDVRDRFQSQGPMNRRMNKTTSITPGAAFPSTLHADAYHEAGHAVIGHKLGLVIGATTIRETDEAFGWSEVSMPNEHRLPQSKGGEAPVECRGEIEDCITAYCAGPEAERRLTGQEFDAGSNHDWDGAFELAGLVCHSREEEDVYVRRLLSRAQALVEENWSAIEAVARELVERETLDGELTAAIIREIGGTLEVQS